MQDSHKNNITTNSALNILNLGRHIPHSGFSLWLQLQTQWNGTDLQKSSSKMFILSNINF